MKNFWLLLLVVIVLPGTEKLWAQNDLAGEWSPQLGRINGQPVPVSQLGQMKLKVTGTSFEATSGGMTSSGRISKVNGSLPAQATFIIESGADAGRQVKAIYEVGRGIMKIAFSQSDEFPTEFKSSEENRYLVVNYRGKPGSGVAASAARGRRRGKEPVGVGQIQTMKQ
ncbi:MAG: hypothetical protein AAGA30_10900 [Planctomycetota bacterium]